jgi:hypothetical protein
VSDVYIPTIRSFYSAAGKYLDQSWEYINRSQPHKCGNWTEAAIFLFWEYIDENFVAVQSALFDEQRLHILVHVRTGRGVRACLVYTVYKYIQYSRYVLNIEFFYETCKMFRTVNCNQVL